MLYTWIATVPQLHVWCLGIPDSIKMPSFNLITVRKCGFWTVFPPLYSVISNISVLNQSLTSFNCCHLRMLKSGAFYYFINRFIKNPFVIKVSLVILLSFQLTCLFISIGMTNVSLVSFTSLKLVTNKQ